MNIEFIISGRVFRLVNGDVTRAKTRAIVNAANSRLAGGSGVDGAIHAAAGPDLPKACAEIIAARGSVPAGSAALTPGFSLCEFIIHAVGPIWRGGGHGEPEALRAAYQACLNIAQENAIASLAFPALSCGAYGFPHDLAAPIALGALAKGLANNQAERIELYLYANQTFNQWADIARQHLENL